jgi:hypothetical protein
MAYCNSGPAVAAYLVEKITGRRFEDYVTENFFTPIGMKTASYFRTSAPATTDYHHDGKTPYPYWNILFRPAGSINASANDMAAYLAFYLSRGTVNGVEVMPAASIDRMEIPTRTWAAQEGLRAGYGLSNYWSIQDGFVYHGHNGGVNGGLTELAYMPSYGDGYFFSINSDNADAFGKIGKTIRGYVTRQLTKPEVPLTVPLPANANSYAGWYEPDSPRVQMFYSVERLLGLVRVHFAEGRMLLAPITGFKNDIFLPVTGRQFRKVPDKEAPSPVATAELLAPPNVEGQFIQVSDGTATLRRIPGWMAISEIILTAGVVLAIVSVIVYAPFWLLGGLSPKCRRPEERAVRWSPLIAVLSIVAMVVLVQLSIPDIINRMGNLTVWSAGVFLCTLIFPIASLASAVAVWRADKNNVRRSVRRHSIVVAAALLIASAYLAYWGMIGLRTWA